MPSEGWLDTSKPKTEKTDWVSPLPAPDKDLKSLDEIGKARQEEAMKPPPMPEIPLPPAPVETIPYKSIASAVDAAAKTLLDATVVARKSDGNLSKATLGVDENGEKGREIFGNIKAFKARIDSICSDMEKLSNEIGMYHAKLSDSGSKSE